MTYIGSRSEEIADAISDAEELYDRRESLALDRPDLLVTDWDFDPANYDLPALIQSWDELLNL